MEMHKSTYGGKPAFLFVDDEEKIVELPTEYFSGLASSANSPAMGTLDRYSEKIVVLGNFLERHELYGKVSLDNAFSMLRAPVLDDFYRSLQQLGLSAATVRLTETAVRNFTNWLNTSAANYVHKNPIYPEKGGWRTPTPTNHKARWLSADDVIKLALSCHFEAQRTAIHFLYDTGVRVSELPRVLLSDLPDWHHYPEGQMYFPLLIRGSKGKGGQIKERNTIISRAMLSRLAKHHNTDEYRFNFDFDESAKPALLNVFGEIWTSGALQALIRKARDRARIPRASPHMLRHGTAFSVTGGDHGKTLLDGLVIAKQMLGHSNIRTTEKIYSDIPSVLARRIGDSEKFPVAMKRYEEAQRILDASYLPQKKEPQKQRIGGAA